MIEMEAQAKLVALLLSSDSLTAGGITWLVSSRKLETMSG